MTENITYRMMQLGEEKQVSQLMVEIFREFVAHEYSQEGIKNCEQYVAPDSLLQRVQAEHFILVAILREKIIGALEISHHQEISLLFVDKHFHCRGIAKELFQRALMKIETEKPEVTRIKVNASRYAVPIYEKLGFGRTGAEKMLNGIIFIPMERPLVSKVQQ